MESSGEKAPEAIAEKNYSGKRQIRIPPSLHRRLAMEAAEENVSLNRYMSQKLSG